MGNFLNIGIDSSYIGDKYINNLIFVPPKNYNNNRIKNLDNFWKLLILKFNKFILI